MLQSQIHKANDLLDEAKSSQSNIDSLSESAREISRHACHDLTSRLREDGDSIARQWSDIVSRIKDYTIKLEQALRRNRGFEDHIQELEIWISDKNREVPTDDNPIYYAEQISERLAKFQHIRNEISRKEQTLNSLVEESKPVLTSASSGTAKELTDDIDKLLSNFNNLTRKLDQKIKNHEEIQHIYNDLKDLMDDESEWLKQLQMETFSSIGAGATSLDDASRELDALERLVKNHPRNNRKRIRDLKKSLDSKRVVIPALGNQITQFEFRWDQLHEDALKRIQVLEESVIESKRTEQQTRKLQDWMNHVDELLNTKIERISQNDMDLLREEFEESARTLDMLNDKISFLRISGKSEAARRLDDQVVCLRKRYNELHQKYRQCQIPSDFEPNLERCRRVVHEVEQNIHAVDIKSDDPDIIQMQLDSCMKLYNILFEIQPEVENVIRAGRRITDNGSVENPELIIRQISNLKQSFNDMGTKVTAGKERLERSLRSLRRFHREHKQIVDWLNKAEDEIARLEAQPELQAANDQIDWIRSTKVDIRKLDSNFEILRSLQRDSEKEADKPLIGLTDKINSVERRVEQFSRRLRERTNRIEEQQNQVEDLYLKFSRLYDDLQSKLDYLDSLLYNVERHYEKGIIEQIKSELEAVRTNIENLRNLARVLTTQTDRYTNIVTPDVDNLYRRIDECNERLNIVQDTHTKRHATASIPVTVSVGSSEQHTSRSNQNKQFVENSRYYDESMTTTTTSGERRRRSRHKRDVSLSESTDEELTDDEFRKKYGRCLAYLQLIDKLVSKGALSSDSGELANLRSERKGGRVVDREMIERVIKETERTIHVIERKEPNRARKLRDMLCRLEEQLHRIESKIDAQGSVSPSNVTGTKFDKGVSRSTLVDGYDSSDFIYSTDFAVDDRSVASEPVVYPPTARGQRYSRFDKWHTISNRQQEREGSVKLQPLLRVRSLRAVDRHVQQESSYAGGIDQHNQQGGHTLPVMRNQRRYHSLERGALTKTAAHQYGQHMRPIFYAPICAAPALFTTGYCHPTMSAAMIGTGGQFPIYRERIVDKHIAYREQAADSSAIRRDTKEGSAADIVMSRREIPRTVPVRIVHSSDDYHNESSMMTSVNESSRRFDHKVGGFGTIGTDSSAASYHHDNAVNVSTKIR
ncbi:hypothetical protein GJ496_006771 [Pomphorhynchus laevis]|nr:hypothetical protein GJ496_006771 [Pomphorhynchus laevis]